MATYKPKKKISDDGTLEEIKIPASSVDGIDNYQKIGSVMCYDTSTSDTAGTWTATIPNITELTEGLTIKVRLKTSFNNNYKTNTLNVNGLGAKPVYFRYQILLKDQYQEDSILSLTYTENAKSGGSDNSGWIIEGDYDTTNVYEFRNYISQKTKSVLYRYMLCFVNKDGLLVPANNENNMPLSTTKTLTTESFNLFDSIYFYNSTTTVNANSRPAGNSFYKQKIIDLRYSFNISTRLIDPNPVYLKVTADGSQFKLATDNPITQTLPTSDDGFYYCYLGIAYSGYSIELVLEHPIYLYKDGKIQEYMAYTKSVAEKALSLAQSGGGGGTTTDDKMPIIELLNVCDTNGTMIIDETNPITFSVRVVKGKVEAGDILQLCRRELFTYTDDYGAIIKRKYKLRMFDYHEITEEEAENGILYISSQNRQRGIVCDLERSCYGGYSARINVKFLRVGRYMTSSGQKVNPHTHIGDSITNTYFSNVVRFNVTGCLGGRLRIY